MKPLIQYFFGKIPTVEEERRAIARLKEDPSDYEAFVVLAPVFSSNLKMFMLRYQSNILDRDELGQLAYMALKDAVRKHKIEFQTRFVSFARHDLRNHINDHLKRQVAKHSKVKSLDDNIPGSDLSVIDGVEDENTPTPFESAVLNADVNRMNLLIRHFFETQPFTSDKSKTNAQLSLGYVRGEVERLEDLAQQMGGVTRERARQIVEKTSNRLFPWVRKNWNNHSIQ